MASWYFPKPDPRTVIPKLESIGACHYDTCARVMVDTNQGLTKTYNALKDPACDDPRILDLRRLHEEMDLAVLAAYGWNDIEEAEVARRLIVDDLPGATPDGTNGVALLCE